MFPWIQEKQINLLSNAHETGRQLYAGWFTLKLSTWVFSLRQTTIWWYSLLPDMNMLGIKWSHPNSCSSFSKISSLRRFRFILAPLRFKSFTRVWIKSGTIRKMRLPLQHLSQTCYFRPGQVQRNRSKHRCFGARIKSPTTSSEYEPGTKPTTTQILSESTKKWCVQIPQTWW